MQGLSLGGQVDLRVAADQPLGLYAQDIDATLSEAGFGDIRPSLERMGYVERRPDPHDRRSRLVFLTERGASVRPVTMRPPRASRSAGRS